MKTKKLNITGFIGEDSFKANITVLVYGRDVDYINSLLIDIKNSRDAGRKHVILGVNSIVEIPYKEDLITMINLYFDSEDDIDDR